MGRFRGGSTRLGLCLCGLRSLWMEITLSLLYIFARGNSHIEKPQTNLVLMLRMTRNWKWWIQTSGGITISSVSAILLLLPIHNCSQATLSDLKIPHLWFHNDTADIFYTFHLKSEGVDLGLSLKLKLCIVKWSHLVTYLAWNQLFIVLRLSLRSILVFGPRPLT